MATITTTQHTIQHLRNLTLRATLEDYAVHHSDGEVADVNQTTDDETSAIENPADWDFVHRRVPRYRPINTQLDQSQRRIYQHLGERIFISLMFTGVYIESSLAKVWGVTGGRIYDIAYPIGGEL